MSASKAADRDSFDRLDGFESVAERVVGLVQQAIVADALAPGTRLGTKDDLRRQFGVAPATLGEALRVLGTRGVVELRRGPGGGIFVAAQSPLTRLGHEVLDLRPDQSVVDDCVSVLDALDGEVLRDAALHRTEADVEDLQRVFGRLEEVWALPDRHEQLHLVQQRIWDLHRRIAEISPNVVLKAIYLNLVDHVQIDLADAMGSAGYGLADDRRLRIHGALVDAVVAGDVRMADKANARHRAAPEART